MALSFFVGHDLSEGDARGVVDTDMYELQADATTVGPAGAVTGDAVADAIEPAELLDTDVDELAGMLALVAADRLGGLQVAHPADPQTLQDPADNLSILGQNRMNNLLKAHS